MITGLYWLLAGLWLGLFAAIFMGFVDLPIWILLVLAVFVWAACRCPQCGLPVFYRPSGPPGAHKVRYFLAPPDRHCTRCGLRFKKRKRQF